VVAISLHPFNYASVVITRRQAQNIFYKMASSHDTITFLLMPIFKQTGLDIVLSVDKVRYPIILGRGGSLLVPPFQNDRNLRK